jgi:hypothetical protein
MKYRIDAVGRVWREAFYLGIDKQIFDIDELRSYFVDKHLDKILSEVEPKLTKEESEHLKKLMHLDDEQNWGRMLTEAIKEVINKHTEQ